MEQGCISDIYPGGDLSDLHLCMEVVLPLARWCCHWPRRAQFLQLLQDVAIEPCKNDVPKWLWHSSRPYKVAACYGNIDSIAVCNLLASIIWSTRAHFKAYTFLWLVERDRDLRQTANKSGKILAFTHCIHKRRKTWKTY